MKTRTWSIHNRLRRAARRAGAPLRKRGPSVDLNDKVSAAILTCLTREELVTLRKEIDTLVADPNYTPKPFTL